jgi:hypothetical protein
MSKFLDKLVERMELRAIANGEIARFDGIGLADARWRKDSQGSFRQTIEESLRLLREYDSRRYERIRRHIKWIVNVVTNSGARYRSSMRACYIEFVDFPGLDCHIQTAIYAAILVHEATHGFIESREIGYTEKNRVRIERLCTAEQNRFVTRLAAADPERFPVRLLHCNFDESDWHWEWTATPLQKRRTFISRWLGDARNAGREKLT